MTTEQFENVFNETFERSAEVLMHKAKEYAADGDRLHNFKVAADLEGISTIAALGGMMCKHTVSIYDLIREHEQGSAITMDLWEEKIIDNINYLILLRAALKDEWQAKNTME